MARGNYIKNLQESNQFLNEALAKVKREIMELRIYLQSEKFRCGDELDGYVNCDDVLRMLRNTDCYIP